MTEDHAAREPALLVPAVVVEATRALLWLATPADARRIAEDLVRGLGGTVVPAATAHPHAIPADISFGDGPPVLAAAPAHSSARALLDRYLATFLLDARQALELSGRAERLAEAASTDVLTGLPNRRMLSRVLGRLGADDTVIMVDLDYFKQINDLLGHAAGDEVLRSFGATLRSNARGRDVVGRFGGEEFIVVLGPPAGADAFLQRLRQQWTVERPHTVTFSAGIARSVGNADRTLALADEALYRAKDAGRDRWMWAPVTEHRDGQPHHSLEPYLEEAVHGRRRPAIRLALDLLDHGVSKEQVVVGLLAPAQFEIGERWYRNELTVADEHLATGVSSAALDALAAEVGPSLGEGRIVVACAEGDWHSLAAQMFGESLRGYGVGVTVLGASTPTDVLAGFLVRMAADALAVSCSLPMFFPGVVRLVDAAHGVGLPVLAGGRAFGGDEGRARRLGADAWARGAADAAAILAAWRSHPPAISAHPTVLDPLATRLAGEAADLAASALQGLAAHFAPLSDYDGQQLARTREDLVCIVQFLAAAILAGDDTVFTEFVEWLQRLLVTRGVSPRALAAGLDALRPALEVIDAGAVRLLVTGRRLLDAPV